MFKLALAILFATAGNAQELPADLNFVTQTGCKVDTEPATDVGLCKLYKAETGEVWLVYYDEPNSIKFIRYRSLETGEYIYTYERLAGVPA